VEGTPLQDQIVRGARANLLRAKRKAAKASLPDEGARWRSYSAQIASLADRATSAAEVVRAALRWQGSFESRHQGQALIDYAAMFGEHYKAEYPEFEDQASSFTETPLAPSDLTAEHDGRLVSSPALEQTHHIMRCLQFIRPETVLDIGGGTGSTGRLWLTNSIHRPRRYIDMDLPESLFVAEVYLRATLPDARVAYIHNAYDLLSAGLCSADVLLIPTHNHHLLKWLSIDLAFNTGSLQEMTTDYAALYASVIDRTRARFFYSSNYFAQKISLLLESMNYAAPVMPRYWCARFLRWWPDPDRGVAQIMFERAEGVPPPTPPETIKTPADFLLAFDAARHIDDAARVLTIVRQARDGMGYTPKEALYLARKAAALAPGSAAAAAEVQELEQLAAIGIQNIGMIGPPMTA
jgi:putative sugar O-methyltransferase